MNQHPPSPPWLAPLTLMGAAVLATYLVGLLLWPFLPAVAASAVIATLAYPLHTRLRGSIRTPTWPPSPAQP